MPGASNGLRRRRCGRARRAAARMSSRSTLVRPFHAACAAAARAVTMSARMPSTSNAAHTSAILSSAQSLRSTWSTSFCAAWMRSVSVASSSAYRAANASGSVSYASRRRTTSTRVAGITRCRDLDGEAEPVEQLGAELALLGVHGADEDEPRRVLDRDTVALDRRTAHRGSVQQEVDEVVVQQVDLIDVEDAAMRASEQAGLVLGDAVGQRLLEVQRTQHAILGGADGQLDEAYGPGLDIDVGGERAVGRQRVGLARIGREPVAGDHVDRRQHRGEGAHHGRLGGALLAAHEHAADRGRDRREGQGERHVVGSDDGAERIVLWHMGLPLDLPSMTGAVASASQPRGRSSDFPGRAWVTAAGPVPDSHRLPDSPREGHLETVMARLTVVVVCQ